MSNAEYYEDEFDEETEGKNPLRQALKQKEKELAEAKKVAAEAAEAKRELAFIKAGVPMDNPMSRYFVKAYDGDLDPDAIKQAALEAQLISPPDQIPQDEAQAWGRTNQVAAGAGTSHAPVNWDKRLSEARTEAEVMAILAEAQEAL
jgi:hypothetical protein